MNLTAYELNLKKHGFQKKTADTLFQCMLDAKNRDRSPSLY